MKKLSRRGFTLIELLVVIVILGLLAAIAVPIYASYRIKANRSDAKVALVTDAQLMERYFSDHNTYAGATVGDVSNGDTLAATSEHGFYQISLTVKDLTATTYTIQAKAQGAQAADTGCTTLTIDQTGKKLPASCW